ncbi:MAG: exodeoxyribonuclease VII large subunit [Alphaproteobacteria bacterium]|nr:exodeoxyribonuclease VII large subunit [Alphaproteobacteria bacterium]
MNTSVWTVGALCKAVADALSARFDAVRVRGEISGFTQASSGHCYFSLKDAQGQLRCAMFRRAAMQLGRVPRNGDRVEVTGRLGVYEARGDLQMVVEAMHPLGQGALFEEFLRLKQKLEQEGLFEAGLKKQLPPHPRRIGIVTSLGAAALHDVAIALRRRVPHLPVVLSPALVQGVDAPASLIGALDRLEQVSDLDLILLVRGGGSMEDLWAFNDEGLVRRIRTCRAPVICGVGHETDFTLADFAADLRAPTPTAAAELCAVSLQERRSQLQALAHWTQQRIWRDFDAQLQHLDRLQTSLGRPQSACAQQQAQLSRWALRLTQASRQIRQSESTRLNARAASAVHGRQQALVTQHQRLQMRQAQLALLDPRQVLERGFSWLQDEQGRALTRTSELHSGQQVQVVMADGEADLRVLTPRPRV